ncbi:hypothetical protein [Methylocystis echinoides]|uniref:Uncharacterized protein n=1 Tax=Methylocystis echinoides TaxID=29468 RepID=A0A9W6GZ54_9HYPH|nr:hypothetical protein [Methylocystis echinoides]GLI95569.1 hypothetical protein LMG27198_45610 [Methylocystis echinoides]
MVVWARTFREKYAAAAAQLSDRGHLDEAEDVYPYAEEGGDEPDHWTPEDEAAE